LGAADEPDEPGRGTGFAAKLVPRIFLSAYSKRNVDGFEDIRSVNISYLDNKDRLITQGK
jgi:hypothetical protein